MLIEIIEAEKHYVVVTNLHGGVPQSVPIDDYQIACAYAQGIAAGAAMMNRRAEKPKIIYPHMRFLMQQQGGEIAH